MIKNNEGYKIQTRLPIYSMVLTSLLFSLSVFFFRKMFFFLISFFLKLFRNCKNKTN